MSIQRKHGLWGESLAADALRSAGMEIIATNWHYHHAEIDIIAKDGNVLVFVEVKMRSYSDYGQPAQMVRKKKQRMMVDAAMAYMRSIQYEWEIRFDIVSILGDPDSRFHLRHYKNAFFPGLGRR